MTENKSDENESSVIEEIKAVLVVLEEKKAEAIRVIDLRGQSSITDYVVLVTAISEPHAKALKASLSSLIRERGIPIIGNDSDSDSGWLVFDAFNYMVHIQTEQMRDFYGLEDLWLEGEELDFS